MFQKRYNELWKSEDDLDLFAMRGPVPVEEPVPVSPAGLAPPPPPELPLVGRVQLFEELRQQLCVPHGSDPKHMIVLTGMPGVGKTALARALAHDAEVRTRFGGNVVWIALGPHPDVKQLLCSWGSAWVSRWKQTWGPTDRWGITRALCTC